MSDDTRQVLDLLAQGKVTVDEAHELLRAIGAPQAAGPLAPEGGRKAPRYIRINVHKAADERDPDKDVTIRVPIAVVKSGMRLGSLIPGFAADRVTARLRERGLDVDFSKLDAASIETVLREIGDTSIEVDSGKAQVRITTE